MHDTSCGRDQTSLIKQLTFYLGVLNYWKSIMPCMTRQDLFLNTFCKDPVPSPESKDEDGLPGQCSSLEHTSCLLSSWAIGTVTRDKDLQERSSFGNKTNQEDICREVTSDDYRHHDPGPERLLKRLVHLQHGPSLSTPCLLASSYFIPLRCIVLTTILEQRLVSEWCVYCTEAKIKALVSN